MNKKIKDSLVSNENQIKKAGKDSVQAVSSALDRIQNRLQSSIYLST